MVIEILLVVIVLLFAARMFSNHLKRRRESVEQPQRPTATITLTSSDGTTQSRDVDSSGSEGGSFDEWVAEMEKGQRAASAEPDEIVPQLLDDSLPVIDLRRLPASRFRIVGTLHWLRDSERARFGGTTYHLVREPANEFDRFAVAVYGRGRKVGFLSTAKAAGVAPELDRLGEAAFTVNGDGVSRDSSRLWVDIPRLAGLRAFRLD